MVTPTPNTPGWTDGPWEICPAKTVEDEFMIVAGEGHDHGLVAVVRTLEDARLTPTPEQARAAIERLATEVSATDRHHGFRGRPMYVEVSVDDLATLLAIIGASAKALGPFAEGAVKYDARRPGGVDAYPIYDCGVQLGTLGDFREAGRLYALIAPKAEG